MIIIGGIPIIIGIMIIILTTILISHQRKPSAIEVIPEIQVILLIQAQVKRIHKLIQAQVKRIHKLIQAQVKRIHKLIQAKIRNVENIIGSPYEQ
jgi:hypothetical protein